MLNPVLAIDGLGKGLAPLDGPWQFHLGDNPAWASPAIDDATGQAGWEQIKAEDPWGAQGHPAYTGFAWYRRHFLIQTSPGASADLALMLLRVDDAYEIYLNGVLIGKNGGFPPHPFFYYPQPAQTYGLGPVRDGVIAIRVWKEPLETFDSDQMGGLYEPPIVGSPTAIASRKAELDYGWLRSVQFTVGLEALYLLVMLISLIAWLRNRTQPVPLWMAAYSFAEAASSFLADMRLPLSYKFILDWLQPMFALQDIALWFLVLYLLRLDANPRLLKWTQILALIRVAIFALDGTLSFGNPTAMPWGAPLSPWFAEWSPRCSTALTAATTLEGIFPILMVILVLRKGMNSTRWPVAIAATLSTSIQLTVATSLEWNQYTHWTFGDRLLSPLFTIAGNPFIPQRLAEILLIVAILYAVFRFQQESNDRRVALEQELKSAREMQQLLVPASLPDLPGYAVTSAYRPALEVGGDFFQIIPLPDASTLVVLGDVSGKGLKAAMTVSLIVGAIRTLAEVDARPAAILTGLNRRLHTPRTTGFTTCIALRIDADGHCAVSTAGHPAPFLNGWEIEMEGAFPLGLTENPEYVEKRIRLAVGDNLTLYTDGLLEARNSAGELYGFARLAKLFAGYPTAAAATDAAIAFGQDDDITVLTLKRLPAGVQSTTEISAPALAPA